VSPAWWPARAGGYSVAVAGISLSTAGVLVFARPAPAPPSTWPGLASALLAVTSAAFPATAGVEGGRPKRPSPFASGEASGSDRLRFSPQVSPQPTHPVRQNAARHREVNGDVAVVPTVYKSAVH